MINIYLDTSGSMCEMGKDSALLYIAKSIEDYCNFKNINTAFFYLNGENIKKIIDIKFSNKINLNPKNIQTNSILLSDGLFNINEKNIFDIAISIGIDSDISNLKKISTKVFSNDNILECLEYLIFQKDLLSSNAIEEDDEDEW